MTQIFVNPAASEPFPASVRDYDVATAERLRKLFARAPGFAQTPLLTSDTLARETGIARLWIKDERARWNIGSFKALGGAYAVASLVAETLSRETGRTITCEDVFKGSARDAGHLTFATATAGNHGRAVAFGAKLAGARAVIFVYDGVPDDQTAAIAALGARIVHVPTDKYEIASGTAVAEAAKHGWTIVSDMSWDGYEDIPSRIMHGYTVLAAEACAQLPEPPTHIFLQAGCGGLAAPLAAYFAQNIAPRPDVIVVEPLSAPCCLEAVKQNRMVDLPDNGRTIMGRLDVRAPSSNAWPVLRAAASAFVAVDEATAEHATRMMAQAGILTSPTGAAGFAGVLACAGRPQASLKLDRDSRVLVIVTESPTVRDARYH